MGQGVIEMARELGITLPPQAEAPDAKITPEVMVDLLREISWHYFPLLAPNSTAVTT
jgi:hypothetical protein